MLAFLIPTCVMGVFAFLVCLCEKLEKKEDETKEEVETEEEIITCLMETIEAPQIASYGYYNKYGAWVDQDLEKRKKAYLGLRYDDRKKEAEFWTYFYKRKKGKLTYIVPEFEQRIVKMNKLKKGRD